MKDVLKQAQDLLKVAKESPEQFQELTKAKKPDFDKARVLKQFTFASTPADRTKANQAKADARDKKIKKSDVPAEEQGGAISADPTPAHGVKKSDVPTDPQGGAISSEMRKDAMAAAPMKKDDKPHPAQSAPAQAHNVAEGDESLHHALKILDTP